MNMKLFSVLLLNVNIMFANTCTIKNDGNTKLFVVDPNSGYAISIDPAKTGKIDTTLRGIKKLFVNETLNFFEEEQPNSGEFKLKYQLRDNDFARRSVELSYNQIRHYADQANQEFVISKFK